MPRPSADVRDPTAAPHGGFRKFRWVIVGLLCAVGFVLYIDRVNIVVAAVWIQQEYQYSKEIGGILLSAFLWGYAIGLVPGGWLADRFGAHRVLTVAGICWAGLTALMALAPSGTPEGPLAPVKMLVAARLLLGMCEGCAYPTFGRALANWMPRGERAMASGLIHSGSSLGAAFTQPFIAVIIGQWGWRAAFLVSGVITLAVAAVWRLAATDRPAQHPWVSPEERATIAAGQEEARVAPADRRWYGRMLRSRSAWMLCLSEVFYGMAGFVFVTWFCTYFVEERQAGTTLAAYLSALPFLAMAIGAPVGGVLCDLCVRRLGSPWGRRTVPLVSITLAGCALMIAPVIGNNVASAAVFALSAGLLFTAASAFWSTLIDITRRGPGLLGGLMNGSGQVGGAIATLSFAWLQQQPALGPHGALQVAGLMGVLSGLVWLLIDSSRQIDEAEPPGTVPILAAKET